MLTNQRDAIRILFTYSYDGIKEERFFYVEFTFNIRGPKNERVAIRAIVFIPDRFTNDDIALVVVLLRE